jgi:hypothetical protein
LDQWNRIFKALKSIIVLLQPARYLLIQWHFFVAPQFLVRNRREAAPQPSKIHRTASRTKSHFTAQISQARCIATFKERVKIHDNSDGRNRNGAAEAVSKVKGPARRRYGKTEIGRRSEPTNQLSADCAAWISGLRPVYQEGVEIILNNNRLGQFRPALAGAQGILVSYGMISGSFEKGWR